MHFNFFFSKTSFPKLDPKPESSVVCKMSCVQVLSLSSFYHYFYSHVRAGLGLSTTEYKTGSFVKRAQKKEKEKETLPSAEDFHILVCVGGWLPQNSIK